MNVRPETIKLLEESIGDNLLDMCLRDFFGGGGNLTPKVRETSKYKQMGHQTKKLLHSKETY